MGMTSVRSEVDPDPSGILVDTSAWVEFLRGTGSAEHLRLREMIESDFPLATTDTVVMEILAGARDRAGLDQLRRFLLHFRHFPTSGLADFEGAAEIYRRCRAEGETLRSLLDCVIASVAIRAGVPVLAQDRDYEVIARYTELDVVGVD